MLKKLGTHLGEVEDNLCRRAGTPESGDSMGAWMAHPGVRGLPRMGRST
jgi:hypothetical protein